MVKKEGYMNDFMVNRELRPIDKENVIWTFLLHTM